MRTPLAIAGVFVAALILGGVAWLLLADEGDEPTVIVAVDGDSNDVTPTNDPEGVPQHRSMQAYPFAQFMPDIDALRAVTPKDPDGKTWKDNEHAYNQRIVAHKFAVQFDDVPVQEVVDYVIAECAKVGLSITDLDMPMPNHRMSIFRVSADAFEVIAAIQDATKMDITYAPTEFGTCIGGEAAVQAWYMQTNQRRAQENAASELDSSLLDSTFTINVVGAHVGAIVAKMTSDTGVEIVIGPKVWNQVKPLKMSTTKPWTLRKGLKKLASKLRGFIRVKGDRVFLIKL